MKLEQFGLVLEGLRESELERLRQWRNNAAIRQHMEYQEEISPAMQHAWFERVQTTAYYYFIIRTDSQPIGLIHLAQVDDRSAEAGLFIGEADYWGTSVPARASLCILHFAFEELRLQVVQAKVKRDNWEARRYNQSLGFVYQRDAEHPDFIWMELTARSFVQVAQPLIRAATASYSRRFQLIFELDQPRDPLIEKDLQRRRAIRAGDSFE